MQMRQPVSTPEDVAQAVRARRGTLHLTQQEVADMAGVSRQFIASLEQNHPGAELAKTLTVLDALHLRPVILSDDTVLPSRAFMDTSDIMATTTRDRRLEHGWTIRQLADAASVPDTLVTAIEAGHPKVLDVDSVRRVFAALDVEVLALPATIIGVA